MARRILDRALGAGAVLGVLVLLGVGLGAVLGVHPVFLRSGSMAPAMPTGTLALVRSVPAADLQVGDVVCVRADGGRRVTHRITAIDPGRGAGVLLTLRGDANDADDAQRYPVVRADRVVADVPGVGYLFGWATTPWGLLVVGGLVTGLLHLVLRGDRPPPAPGRRVRRPADGVAAGAGVAALVALLVVGPGQVRPARAAAWTDPVTGSGTTLTAATVAAPATFTCGALGVLSVTFSWAAVPGATNYTVHYGAGGALTATVTGTSATLTAAITGGTAWVEANRVFPSTTWTSGASATRSYTVAVVSLCA